MGYVIDCVDTIGGYRKRRKSYPVGDRVQRDPWEDVVSVTEPAGEHADEHAEHAQHGYIGDKKAYLARLKRIEGQARGLQRMVEDEKYCIDILTQISAMTKALESVALGLLDDHLAHCVVDAAAAGGPEADAKIKEASAAIARLVRS
jgi:DNA-binding FrmR family transcriptional regulator